MNGGAIAGIVGVVIFFLLCGGYAIVRSARTERVLPNPEEDIESQQKEEMLANLINAINGNNYENLALKINPLGIQTLIESFVTDSQTHELQKIINQNIAKKDAKILYNYLTQGQKGESVTIKEILEELIKQSQNKIENGSQKSSKHNTSRVVELSQMQQELPKQSVLIKPHSKKNRNQTQPEISFEEKPPSQNSL